MTNLLDIKDLSKEEIENIINYSSIIKKNGCDPILKNKNILMIFEKPSLRTRISFEVCINDLGGKSLILNSNEFKFGHRESIFDTAKVLERYVDFVIIRSFDHKILRSFSKFFSKPIINALTDHSHPCQVLADLLTIKEKLGNYSNKKIAWFGDCNNVTQSWIEMSVLLDIPFYIASPDGVNPKIETMNWVKKKNGKVVVSQNVEEVAKNADCVITDTWLSMGDDKKKSIQKYKPYQVNKSLMSYAKKNALFLHCLPAQRGIEVTSEVIDSKKSVIFDEAENRVHVQKSIINFCFNSKAFKFIKKYKN